MQEKRLVRSDVSRTAQRWRYFVRLGAVGTHKHFPINVSGRVSTRGAPASPSFESNFHVLCALLRNFVSGRLSSIGCCLR